MYRKILVVLIITAISSLSGCAGRNEAILVADELRDTNLAAKSEVDTFFRQQQKLNKAQANLLFKSAATFKGISKISSSSKLSCLNLISESKDQTSKAYRQAVTEGVSDYQKAKQEGIARFNGLNTPLNSRLKQAQKSYKANPSDVSIKMQFYSLYVQVRENEQTFNTEFSEKADQKLIEYLAAISHRYKSSNLNLANLATQQCGKLPTSNTPDFSDIETQLLQTATLLNDSNVLNDSNQQLQHLLDSNAKAGDEIKNYFAYYSANTVKNFALSLPKDFLNILLNREEAPTKDDTTQAAKQLEDNTLGLVKKELEGEYKSLMSVFKGKASTMAGSIKEYGESFKAILGR